VAEGFIDLVGSGMSSLLDQSFQNLPPLDGYGKAPFMTLPYELLEHVLLRLHARLRKLS